MAESSGSQTIDNTISEQLRPHFVNESEIPLAFRHLKPIRPNSLPKIKPGVLYEVEGLNKPESYLAQPVYTMQSTHGPDGMDHHPDTWFPRGPLPM